MTANRHSPRRRRTTADGFGTRRARRLVAVVLFAASAARAQGDDGTPRTVRFSLPVELEGDHGAANGDAVIGRLTPLVEFPLKRDWTLINLALAVVADTPDGVIRVTFVVPLPGNRRGAIARANRNGREGNRP